MIATGHYLAAADIQSTLLPGLVTTLADYREQTGVTSAVLGMSGGVDSALTAALFKRAGWRVIGYTLPIYQDTQETRRGVDACLALGIEHVHLDLSRQYDAMSGAMGAVDPDLQATLSMSNRIRLGNIRARLRMMALYDQAARYGGLVAGTDNFSEFSAGFWTLHGDVGDLAPIQALLKSWEVPALARFVGVPEDIWRAKPTDGLAIDDGDEAQLGVSYLEWDLMLLALIEAGQGDRLDLGDDARAAHALACVAGRMKKSWFKRTGPIRLPHPGTDRFGRLERLEHHLTLPDVILEM